MADLPETAVSPPSDAPPLKVTLKKRLEAEGRWGSVEPLRDQMMREARKGGVGKEEAQDWVYGELERLYPPLQPVVIVAETQADTETVNGEGVSFATADGVESAPARPREGFGALPADWPALPDNAPLPVELGWVQAQRLWIVEERQQGQSIVRLSRASAPAPSRAALGWLDTAIRNPAKWADICAKGLGQQELETDIVKRERRGIDEVRALLAETVAAANK